MTDPIPAGKPSGARLLVGLFVVGAIAGGLYLATDWRETKTAAVEAEDPAPKSVAESLEKTPAPEAADEELAALEPETPADTPEDVVETDTAEVEATSEPTLEPEREPVTPSLDVVRVTPDGGALVAGRAEPGARVTVRADDDALAEVEADAEGNFVAIFEAELSGDARALTLEAEADGETQKSEDIVVLLPSGAPDEAADNEPVKAEAEVEVVEAETTIEPAENGAAVEQELAATETEAEDAGPPVQDVAEANAATDEESEEPQVAATAVIRDGVIEVKPLARPVGTEEDEVSIASISYADAGDVQLAGFGLAGSTLRAYVDDEFTQAGFVDASGQWSIDLGDVEVGVYRLRVDQIDEEGTVASRIETPFKRDVPRARTEGAPGDAVSVIVQPGNNLWTLARIHYGSGVQYTQIFNANSDLIRDPDLIYPGQILGLPESDTN